MEKTSLITKIKWNLPWLVRYPIERTKDFLGTTLFEKKHVIFTIANHFEPSWSSSGLLPLDEQKKALDAYHKIARRSGESLRDHDGTKFRHTNFFPGEQYDRELVAQIAGMQAEGLGEVEIHLHHGVEKPDTSENLRRQLTEFRDRLAEEHLCLSRLDDAGAPMYAFVHGNLALGNSAGGAFCGVDDELRILAETGCYVDMTLPSAPDRSQVPMLNKIYECGLPLDQPAPHRTGRRVEINGKFPQLPLIFTGPLVFNWSRRIKGLPVPRVSDGGLVYNQPMDLARFKRWLSANITVRGNSEWVFIKLYCHGFFAHDQKASIGEDAVGFFERIIENGERTGAYKVHFASAREATNMVFAAIDGKRGNPHDFRDYRLKSIMK